MGKKIVTLLLFCSISLAKAQNISSPYILRTTLGISGASENITINNNSYSVQQSTGQAGVIGTFKNNGYTLRQGFIQPNIWAKIVDKNLPISLTATFYPNPFSEIVTLNFSEKITSNIDISVYDLLGKLVLSKKYQAKQNLNMQFGSLSLGGFILKVTANNKQFIKNIIKSNFR